MTPKSWMKSTIGELCDLAKGKSPIAKTPPGPYPLVTTGRERKMANHFQFDMEAVCVPMISSTGHGHASLHRVHYQQGKFALGNILTALLVRDRTVLLPRFLALYLNYFKDQLIVPLMVGAANMSLTMKRLADVSISFPPMEEQEQIVQTLDEAEALRKLRAKADQRTADLIPAIFYDTFGDPTTNPKGWPIQSIASITSSCQKCDPRREPNRQFSYINIASIDGSTGRIITTRQFTGSEAPSRARQLVHTNDVIISTVRPNLRGVALLPRYYDGFLCSTGFCVLRPTGIMDGEYLYALARTNYFTQQLLKKVRGANYPAVTDKVVRGIAVPVPPLSLQREFAARVAKVRELEAEQAESRKHLDELFVSLLCRAFKGELISIKVPEKVRSTTPFKDDAAVLCFLLAEMEKLQRPTTEFFVQKHIFATKHHLRLPVNSLFVRKAAGPWSHELKRKAIHAAIKTNWLSWNKQGNLVCGPSFNKGLNHAATVLGESAAQLVQLVKDLKAFGTNGLERWTTVLKVVEDLKEKQQPITRTNIQREINSWPGKSLKEIFAEESVDYTIKMMLKRKWLEPLNKP